MYAEMVNRFSATRPGSWLVKHFAAHVDPVVFRWTNGRFTSTGVPTLPMLTLTVPGRKTGELRSVQLAYHRDGDDYLVVASAMGAERHPAWRYNRTWIAAGRGVDRRCYAARTAPSDRDPVLACGAGPRRSGGGVVEQRADEIGARCPRGAQGVPTTRRPPSWDGRTRRRSARVAGRGRAARPDGSGAPASEVWRIGPAAGPTRDIAATIPQMHTYVQRTDRNIRVFRLTPVAPT